MSSPTALSDPAPVTVAAAQLPVADGAVRHNHDVAQGTLNQPSGATPDLVVFPECFLSGYLLDSRDEVERAAVRADGPELAALCHTAAGRKRHLVIGFLERAGDAVYNSAALIGPGGIVGVTRKRHLPHLGADRFVDKPPLAPLEVYSTPVGVIGIHICYELRFPEVARTLALMGADIIALPTGWPLESAILPDLFAPVRAAENFVYLIAANRPDGVGDRQFVGKSQIIDPLGNVLAHAGQAEAVIAADIDLGRARDKTIVFDTDSFHVSPWKDREPTLYKV